MKGEKVNMSIVILDTFWRLVNIASGILSIARELRSYINGKKDSKKTHHLACQHLMGRMKIAKTIRFL